MSFIIFNTPHITTTSLLPNTITFTISSSFRPRKNLSSTNRNQQKPIIKIETLSARDTIIDFGKHKGKMLGTLPSPYLKWVSKNLRAGDSEYWAKLADQVLNDDVYKDRTEWEFAEKILHGSDESMKSREEVNSVAMLLEISERFGWDNEDKIGWSRINFELLGTSKGGRIPRLKEKWDVGEDERREMVRRRRENEKMEGEEGLRRRERRERMRLRDNGKTVNKTGEKGIFGIKEYIEGKKQHGVEPKKILQVSPFPGRESLLKKVIGKRSSQ